jgi:phosphate-selective porin
MLGAAAIVACAAHAAAAQGLSIAAGNTRAAEQSGQQGGQPGGQGVRFVWRDHPSLRFGRALRLDFQAKFQEDAREPGDVERRVGVSPLVMETWELHRLRVGIEGEVFNRVQFSIERELYERETEDDKQALTNKTLWKDVYVDANITGAFQIRAGRFKIPFGGETLTGIANLDFIYRSLGSNYLTPSREVGAAVHGRVMGDAVNYWVGGFKHDGDNARSRKIKGADDTVAARVSVEAWNQSGGPGILEISGGLARSNVSDESVLPNGLRGRTTMSQYTFYEPVFVKGHRTRLEGDLEFMGGPFSTRAEYLWLSDDRLEQGFGADDLPQARARAWYVSGAAVVTGERKNRPVEPKHWFGAIEVAGRIERLRFGGEPGDDIPFRNPRAINILPVANQAATVGINWFITRWVKLQVNAIREQIDDEERNPVADGAAFWSRIFRLQLVL